VRAGEIRKFDFQSDVFEGEYKLVEKLEGNIWLIENLPPSDEMIARIEEVYRGGHMYLGYHDPFGPERRKREFANPDDVQAAIDEEINERRERAGEQTRMRFVSREKWNEMF
jgi:hypothetical protein